MELSGKDELNDLGLNPLGHLPYAMRFGFGQISIESVDKLCRFHGFGGISLLYEMSAPTTFRILLYFSWSVSLLWGGAREHRNIVSVLRICLNKEIMGWRSTYQIFIITRTSVFTAWPVIFQSLYCLRNFRINSLRCLGGGTKPLNHH